MPRTNADVVLLSYTPNPEELVTIAAKLCYSSLPLQQLQERVPQIDKEQFISKLLKTKHLSPFEHASFTFGIEGISRACSHQIVRHRIASYSQRSQRYNIEDSFAYVVPESFKTHEKDYDIWYDAKMKQLQDWYNDAISDGIPPEDARMLLPNACETKIIVTMNIRELLHFFTTRCCNLAQWEIQDIAIQMLKLARNVAPIIFKHAGPNCIGDRCHEGTRACGKHHEICQRLYA